MLSIHLRLPYISRGQFTAGYNRIILVAQVYETSENFCLTVDRLKVHYTTIPEVFCSGAVPRGVRGAAPQ